MTAVQVKGLAKRFGPVVALDDVDIDFEPGINGLLGPNGAGKTTLLRIVATAMAPDRGRVEAFGADVSTREGRLAARRNLGYLPQEPGFHRNFSAFDFVDYVAILKEWGNRKNRHDEVRRVLSLVGLEREMHKRISQLSGGMRRRVAIAQALIGNPQLLILDEPTAGLDPEQRLRFRELLGTAAAGSIVLLSTHQTDDVAALCQRVVVLLDGRITFSGTPSALAELAVGRVWTAATRDPNADLAWVTGEGRVRQIGSPPSGAELVAPTVEDGYLLLAGRSADALANPAP
ncbi:MAG: ATP-binding cassette domain-containing protein [Acidimicrobiales bacterium]